jgi:hypothetical protein
MKPPGRAAFREQECLFVLVLQHALARGICLWEHDVTNDAESSRSPRSHELIDAVPAVEADAALVRA